MPRRSSLHFACLILPSCLFCGIVQAQQIFRSSLPDLPGMVARLESDGHLGPTDFSSSNDPTAFQQSSTPSPSTDAQIPQTKRILGIIPNFRAVSANQVLPPQSAKEKFLTATEDSFDYSALLLPAALAGYSMATNATPEFHQGAVGYGRYLWHSYVDQSIENYAVEFVVPARSTAPQPQPSSSQPPSDAHIIAMTVSDGTPLQIALDKEVRVRKVGEPISGRVMQPVYVFDHLVIPIGTAATGRISAIDPVPGRTRTLEALNADFTPAHTLSVAFDELILPDGRHIDLHATVVPGSGQVIRLVTADEHKKNAVKDAAAQKMDQARAQWNNAMKQVESPGRMHVVTRYAVAQLPVHPQYINAGTLYSAVVSQPLDFGSESVSSDTLSGIGIQPPPGSLVHAVLLTPLNSATTAKSSDVESQLSQPLVDQGHLILPAGTLLRGSVLQVRPARRLHRNGQLRIAFREVVLPNGAVQTVDTRLQGIQSDSADNAQLDSEGGTQSTSSKTRYLTTGASVGLALIGSGGRDDVGDASPAAGGATGFKLIGLVVGLTFRSHTYGILMSAYGGGRSIYNNFLGMGRNIVFPKDTVMEIGFGNRTSLPMPGANPGESK